MKGDALGPLAVFIGIVDSDGNSLDVLGWKEAMEADGIHVMREPGESEEACGERAARLVRAQPGWHPMSVPVMQAITEKDDNGP